MPRRRATSGWGSKPWDDPQFRAHHSAAMSDYYKGLAEHRRCPWCRRGSAMSRETVGGRDERGQRLRQRRCRHCGYAETAPSFEIATPRAQLQPVPRGLIDPWDRLPGPILLRYLQPLEAGGAVEATLMEVRPLTNFGDTRLVGWGIGAMDDENRLYFTRVFDQPRWRGIVPAEPITAEALQAALATLP